MIDRDASEVGFTLVELLLVVAIIAIIVAIAAPSLKRARMAGNEASAIGSLRAIESAQSTYSSTCALKGFAQSLEDLAKPPPGSTAGFISPDLPRNGVVKSGYYVNVVPDESAVTITIASKTCNAAAADAVSSYFTEAHPVLVGSTGQRSFGADSRGTLYFKYDGSPIAAGMNGAQEMR
jgi:type IV pilus assembly protein PilA